MLKKILLFTFCLLWLTSVQAQKKVTLDFLCQGLNWESFGIISNYASVTYRFDSVALRIIKLVEKHKNLEWKLVNYLDQQDKTVAIHAILTAINCPGNLKISSKSLFKIDKAGKPNYQNIIGSEFAVNGVRWKLIFNEQDDKGTYSYIYPKTSELKAYWKKRLNIK